MTSRNGVGSEFKSPKDSPGFMLWRVSNEWQREIREALKPHGLSHAQFVLLASTIWLFDHGETVNQAALSRQAAMDKMMVSEVVRQLEKKRLIKRSEDPNDKRCVVIKATKSGVTILQDAMDAVEKANHVFFSRSNLKQKEIVAVLRSLSMMA